MLARLLLSRTKPLNHTAIRSFTELATMRVPQDLADEFSDGINRKYGQFNSTEFNLKPLTKKEGYYWGQQLCEMMKHNYRDFSDRIEDVKESKPFSTLLSGVNVPTLTPDLMPKQLSDIDKPLFKKVIREAEISALAYPMLLDFVPNDYMQDHLTSCIFATEAHDHSRFSYRSSKTDLGWHNDGWNEGKAMPRLNILGVVGDERAQTLFLGQPKIVQHFHDNDKKEFLKALSVINKTPSTIFDFLDNDITILDLKEGKINYADYGDFTPNALEDYKTFYQAIDFLNQTLDVLEPTCVSIKKGDLLNTHNEYGLHRRVLKSRPKTDEQEEGLIGTRLLVRSLGTSKDS